MSVLVTGATGRVGANMVERLLAADFEVTAMAAPGDPQLAKLERFAGLRVVEADLGDRDSVAAACEGVDDIVHLAAQLVRGDTPVDRFYDINALGTLRLLEGFLHSGAPRGRFVLVSTDGTYRPGEPPAVPLGEDARQVPADYYGTSKLLGEVILRNHAAQFDIPFSIVRFATVVSPEEATRFFRVGHWRRRLGEAPGLGRDTNIWQLFADRGDLLGRLEEQVGGAAEETALAISGPTGTPWSLHMVDVRDAVSGVFLALTEDAALGCAFNIAAAAPTRFDDGAAIVAELDGVERVAARLPMDWRLELDIAAARAALGYAPRYGYRQIAEAGLAGDAGQAGAYIPARL